MAERVLIVDDDPVQRRLVENMVGNAGYETTAADGGEAALGLMLATASPAYDCVVLDLVMPDLDGLGVLGRMREVGLDIPVIVQTAQGGIDQVATAMRAGAIDFVVKPAGFERLSVSLRNAMAARTLAGEIARQKRSRSGTLTFRDIITRSPRMHAVLRMAEKAARSAIAVLIEGETGAGKELIARAIHGSGERRAKPFVAVNCGAVPKNLVESILFGHEKGAFTGAAERHDGKFVEASGGTLFLDEVGELPPEAQVKLLRAIQEGEVEPVGGKPVKVDARIISATGRNLMHDVQSGRFREDLCYRLDVFPITVPPLRDRVEDIPELARHFLVRFAAEEGRRIPSISAEALQMLSLHRWPGNVRQLENTMFRAVVLADGEEITCGEFPQIAARIGPCDTRNGRVPVRMQVTLAPADDAGAGQPCENDMRRATIDPRFFRDDGARWKHLLTPASSARGGALLNLLNDVGNVRALDDIEADVIKFALVHYRGQMSEAARRLRIGRSTLYRKLDGLGVDVTNDNGRRVMLR